MLQISNSAHMHVNCTCRTWITHSCVIVVYFLSIESNFRCNFVIISFLYNVTLMYLQWNLFQSHILTIDGYCMTFIQFTCHCFTFKQNENMYVFFPHFYLAIDEMYIQKFSCPAALFKLFIVVSVAIAWWFIQYETLIIFVVYFFFLLSFVLNCIGYTRGREKGNSGLKFHMWQRIQHAHTHTLPNRILLHRQW